MRQGDTPHQISPNAGLLQDQDEKRSLSTVMRTGLACTFPGHPYDGDRHFGGRQEGSGEPGTGAVNFRGRGRFRVPQCDFGLVFPSCMLCGVQLE